MPLSPSRRRISVTLSGELTMKKSVRLMKATVECLKEMAVADREYILRRMRDERPHEFYSVARECETRC